MYERNIRHTRIDNSVVRDKQRSIAFICHLLAKAVGSITKQIQILRCRCAEAYVLPSSVLSPNPQEIPFYPLSQVEALSQALECSGGSLASWKKD